MAMEREDGGTEPEPGQLAGLKSPPLPTSKLHVKISIFEPWWWNLNNRIVMAMEEGMMTFYNSVRLMKSVMLFL